ncbi:MAG TPA: hypothetical protein ENG74_01980, partial [Thermoplasmatales archaeon]|nr:hypothetical protein [Thermoplasmatales archaeon]
MMTGYKSFCVRCGKETDALIDGLCPRCYSLRGNFSSIPTRLRLTVCPICNSVKYRGRWVKEDLDRAMRRIIRDNISLSSEISWKSLSINFNRRGKNLYIASIS